MAKYADRLPANVDGALFVDSNCIDCVTCRWIAPSIFGEASGNSHVYRQPAAPSDWTDAARALIACPTGAIGSRERRPEFRADPYPELIAGDVYYCGYHSAASFGAASYLIRRGEGNILVDSPRFASRLVRRIEALGGVETMFLTHRDDVADHQKFAAHFGCARIIHADDAGPNLASVEQKLTGTEPISIAKDLTVIPVPGHTPGSACLLYRDQFMFTGDHLSWDIEGQRLRAIRAVCWYDWDLQTQSMERLKKFRFEWILPGHSRRCHLAAGDMGPALSELVGRMRGNPPAAYSVHNLAEAS
jgi:glyoxylase-like metal-dependent hydrolase (beta-lactamase superfamily II)